MGTSWVGVKGQKVVANKNTEKMNSTLRKTTFSPVSECIFGKNILIGKPAIIPLGH